MDGSAVRRNQQQYWFQVKKNPAERQELDRLWGSDDDDSSDDSSGRKVAEAIVHAEAQKWLGRASSRRSFLELTRYVDAPIIVSSGDEDTSYAYSSLFFQM